jgi:hypothetical protein
LEECQLLTPARFPFFTGEINPSSLLVRHPSGRSRFVERGRRLEYFAIFWNNLDALAALISVFIAGSVALVGAELHCCGAFTGTRVPRGAKRLSDSPRGSSERASCYFPHT